jgi:pyruvate formate lyase activating enzyme
MIKSSYYNKLDKNKVRCVLCPHNCILKNEQYGICNSRKNINGDLISTSYGNLCSIGIDPIEKKPLKHFLEGTITYSISSAGCNFKCLQCQNNDISQYKPEEKTFYRLNPKQIVNEAINNNCSSISYTYTEPTTFYEFMLDTAKIAKENGLKNVMVSNGYINEEPLEELCKYVDAFNIDLKYWNDSTYKKISGGKLEPVLKTLKIIKDNNCWLEITNLIIPGINDSMDEIKKMCEWLVENGFYKYPIHFSRFFSKYKLMETKSTSIDIILEAMKIAKNIGILHVYSGNI